jgi:polynucleotide 5'-hydroxyl-kinase GRC3/NOL9
VQINTPGWVLGTGLELLADLITQIRPTDVVYMSQEGPWEAVNRLREAAKTIPVHTLPSQVCEYTTRTAAHLRTMQAMSYFHSTSDGTWNSEPLTHMPPWEVRYAGEDAGIFGILPYGEWPSAEHLLDSINGSIVAVVVLDSLEAIPRYRKH